MRISVETNMAGMEGVAASRCGVFCRHPASFIDVAHENFLVATFADDYGAINFYKDDNNCMRGELLRYWSSQYSFVVEYADRYAYDFYSWLEEALLWCKGDRDDIPILQRCVE